MDPEVLNSHLFNFTVTIASRTCLIAADCLLIFTTWMKLAGHESYALGMARNSFSSILLRDGE